MTKYERALQIYPILLGAAYNRQTVRYTTVSELIGVPTMGLAQCLDPLMRYCAHHNLPPLTVLVVNQTGAPGAGLTTTADADGDRECVYAHPWYSAAPLTLTDLTSVD